MTATPQPSNGIAELLARQCGVLTRQQAVAVGYTSSTIRGQLQARRWQQVHPRVYSTVTGPLLFLARVWAALLYAGPDAAACHWTAAQLDGLLDPDDGPVHVMLPEARRVRSSARVVVHRCRRADYARHPARLPPRNRIEETVLDLVQLARSLDDVVSLVTRARQRRLTTADRIRDAMDQRHRLRWRSELGAVLGDVGDGAHSLLEYRYRRDVEAPHRLPRGIRQALSVHGNRRAWCDVHYLEYATIVELDGQAGHVDEGRFRDMRRDNLVVLTGQVPLRYGWADVTERPCAVASEVAAVLRQRGWEGVLHHCGKKGAVCGTTVPQ